MMELSNKENPLVSVTVLTYNSSKFIIETLSSIKAQTYSNIELIISDDCSTDDSVAKCQKWVNENKKRFFKTHLITSNFNTGISANKNRALAKCNGIWLKGVAGDDAFFSDAIQKFVDFIQKHKEVSLLSSNIAYFKNTLEEKNMFKIRNDHDKLFYQLSAQEQYKNLLINNKIHALGVFIKKELIDNIGGCDERYRLLEDHPMWLNLTRAGYKFYYLNEVTGKYRIHDTSVFSTINEGLLFNKYYLVKREFDKDYILPNIPFRRRVSINYIYYQHLLFDFYGLNSNKSLNKKIYNFMRNLNPIVLISKFVSSLKRIINKVLR